MAKSKTMPAIEAAEPKKDSENQKDYEAEGAMDTIMRAEEHKADPAMMARVKKHAGRKLKAMKGLHDIFGSDEAKQEVKSTDDLRSIRNKKATSMGNMG
jgi:hypothetical protein